MRLGTQLGHAWHFRNLFHAPDRSDPYAFVHEWTHWTNAGGITTTLLGYLFTLLLLTALSCTIITQELKFNDMNPVSHKLLRIVMNKSILYAGMTLTSSFGLEGAFLVRRFVVALSRVGKDDKHAREHAREHSYELVTYVTTQGLTQVAIFMLVYIAQFLINRRVSNQIENNYGASWQSVLKYVGVSCVTFLTVGMVAVNMMLNLVDSVMGYGKSGRGSDEIRSGGAAQKFVCALDAWTLLLLSARGMSMYIARAMAVLWTVAVRARRDTKMTGLRSDGGLTVYGTEKRTFVVKRRPTAEVAFYTELHGLADAVLELGMYWSSCMAYAAVYVFRDRMFVHVFDLAILLDIRYLIAHSRQRMVRWRVLHSRAQFVMAVLAKEVVMKTRTDGMDAADGVRALHAPDEGVGPTGRHPERLEQCRAGSKPCECAICMEAIGVGRRLPCGHVFHLKCLLAWIKECDGSRCTCPLCRSDLMGDREGRVDGVDGIDSVDEEGEKLPGWGVAPPRTLVDDLDDDFDVVNDRLWFR